jgi:hypothetical protein
MKKIKEEQILGLIFQFFFIYLARLMIYCVLQFCVL